MANLAAAVEASKARPLANLLVGLNVRHLGGAGARLLAGHFGHLDRLVAATEEEIAEVEGIGPTIAASVAGFFRNEHNLALVEKLRRAGVNFAGPTRPSEPQVLAGASIVVTGTLERWSRERAEEAIKARGGQLARLGVEEDDRGRGRRRARRVQAREGHRARRADPRRGRLRGAARDRSAARRRSG